MQKQHIFLVKLCSTAAASSDKHCCGAFSGNEQITVEHTKSSKLHATLLKYPDHDDAALWVIFLQADSPGTQLSEEISSYWQCPQGESFIGDVVSQKQLPLWFHESYYYYKIAWSPKQVFPQ